MAKKHNTDLLMNELTGNSEYFNSNNKKITKQTDKQTDRQTDRQKSNKVKAQSVLEVDELKDDLQSKIRKEIQLEKAEVRVRINPKIRTDQDELIRDIQYKYWKKTKKRLLLDKIIEQSLDNYLPNLKEAIS